MLSVSAEAANWDEAFANLGVTEEAASETEALLDEALAKARMDDKWCEAVREQLSIPVLTARIRTVLDQGNRAFDALAEACVGDPEAVAWTREEREEVCGGVGAHREAWDSRVTSSANRISEKLYELQELCGL